MKVKYPAIFTPKRKEGTCRVFFPDLEHESEIAYDTAGQLKARSAEELGFALWLCEDSGKSFPLPGSVKSRNLSDGAFMDVVELDYDRFKQGVTVKVIDIWS